MGQYIVFAKVGATLPGNAGLGTIRKTAIKGVDSYGMVCCAKDLGLGENTTDPYEVEERYLPGTAFRDIYNEVKSARGVCVCVCVCVCVGGCVFSEARTCFKWPGAGLEKGYSLLLAATFPFIHETSWLTS